MAATATEVTNSSGEASLADLASTYCDPLFYQSVNQSMYNQIKTRLNEKAFNDHVHSDLQLRDADLRYSRFRRSLKTFLFG